MRVRRGFSILAMVGALIREVKEQLRWDLGTTEKKVGSLLNPSFLTGEWSRVVYIDKKEKSQRG